MEIVDAKTLDEIRTLFNEVAEDGTVISIDLRAGVDDEREE